MKSLRRAGAFPGGCDGDPRRPSTGGIAGTSFSDLLREPPEAVPYSRLPRDHKEWLVLNGYFDPSLSVKPPSTKGLLD
jgi:hypothetical protein